MNNLPRALVLSLLLMVTVGCGRASTPPSAPSSSASPSLVYTTMLSSSVGWGLDEQGQVVRSANGGKNWRVSGAPSLLLAKLKAAAHTLGTSGTLPQSTALSFPSAQAAYIAVLSGSGYASNGVTVFSTTDGGGAWLQAKLAAPQGTNGLALSFPDAMHGWLVESEGGLAGSSLVTTWRTSDGGKTWSQTSSETTFNPTGIGFLNDTEGWLTGTSPAFDRVSLAVTIDAGATWREETVAIPSGNYVVTTYPPLAVLDSTAILPVTLSGASNGKGGWVLFFSQSRSGTWQPLSPIAMPPGLSTYLQTPLYSFQGSQHGWFVMPMGSRTGYVTNDHGVSWSKWQAPSGQYLSMQFVSSKVGYLLSLQRGRGELLRTADGGLTWTRVTYSIEATPPLPHQ